MPYIDLATAVLWGPSLHFDLRFILQVVDAEDYFVSEELLDLAWVPIAELVSDENPPSLRRMAIMSHVPTNQAWRRPESMAARIPFSITRQQ